VLTAIASAIFFASGVDHCRPAVEAHRMEVVGLHRSLGGERGLGHSENILPVLTALLISSQFLHPGCSMQAVILSVGVDSVLSLNLF